MKCARKMTILIFTFQNRVHRSSVKGVSHFTEEQLFRPLGQVKDYEFLVDWDRLDDFVNDFAVDFCTNDIDLWTVDVCCSQESDPVAVSNASSGCVGDFVIEAVSVADLLENLKCLKLFQID